MEDKIVLEGNKAYVIIGAVRYKIAISGSTVVINKMHDGMGSNAIAVTLAMPHCNELVIS